MNNRFKFRFWDKGNQLMVYPPLKSISSYFLAPKYYIPMQCTGLKDKSGTLIYEGDIVKQHWNNNIYKVIWQENAACYLVENTNTKCKQGIYSLISLSNDLEVIGNIYENKELLNE